MEFHIPTNHGIIRPNVFTEKDDTELLYIRVYGLNVFEIIGNERIPRKRRFIIELHCYEGFAFIKFYPHCLKKHPEKYRLRGKEAIGYTIGRKNFIKIIYSCAWVMNDYLKLNPDSFIGYVGQPDEKDDKRSREVAQRASIYDPLIANIFSNRSKYRISSEEIYKLFNMKLIRKYRTKYKSSLSPEQEINYNKFITYFDSKIPFVRHIMTEKGWEKWQSY
jgi:hypothetical protein